MKLELKSDWRVSSDISAEVGDGTLRTLYCSSHLTKILFVPHNSMLEPVAQSVLRVSAYEKKWRLIATSELVL